MISKVKKSIVFGLPALALAVPFIASAQGEGIFGLLNLVGNVINGVIPIIIGLAVLVFLYGVFKYVISNGEDDKAAGRNFMVWGIIGLFVMISVWGLVNLLGDSLNLRNNAPDAPGLPTPR